MAEIPWGLVAREDVRKMLFNCAIEGKWDQAVEVYRQYAWLRGEKITHDGDTALHLAVRDRQERVVEEMVGLVRTEGQYEGVIKSQNEKGNTPLHLAASIGNLPICRSLLPAKPEGGTGVGHEDDHDHYHDLLSIRNKDGENPLFLAARHGEVEPFLFLQRRDPTSVVVRNKRGETILHCALAAGHIPLAFLVIKKYEDLITAHDEDGVSPLHLLAKHPAAFKSGTQLGLLDKIIYHCTLYSQVTDESCDPEDAEKWFGRAARKLLNLLREPWRKLLNLLPEPWRDSIRALFSYAVTFIRICVNPSSGARADEENRLAGHDQDTPPERSTYESPPPNYYTCFNLLIFPMKTLVTVFFGKGPRYFRKIHDQGPRHERSPYESGERSSVGLSLPPNYGTCYNLIMLSMKTVLVVFFGKGRSYVDWIRENKTNHVLSAKILEKILEKYKGTPYDNTGKDPLYKDRSIPYKEDELRLGEIRQLALDREKGTSGTQTEGVQRPTDIEQKQPNQEDQSSSDSINEAVQKPTDLMHKLLEEVQRCSDSMNKLLEEAQTNELLKDKNQKLHKSLKEDSDEL